MQEDIYPRIVFVEHANRYEYIKDESNKEGTPRSENNNSRLNQG